MTISEAVEGRVGRRDELHRLRAVAAEMVRETEFTALTKVLCRPDHLGSRSVGGSGMSPAEVKKFLFGYAPPARNKRADQTSFGTPVPDDRGGEAIALGALVRDIPLEQREQAIVVLLATIASFHREVGVSLPAWFTNAALVTGSAELNQWVERCELCSR